MRRSHELRIITTVLHCYPARWRNRHGDEATVLASALLEDGSPWWSIAGSFLSGVAKERALRKPSFRIGSAVTAMILAITALPLALFASLTPASASGTRVTIAITKPSDATQQLESAFDAHLIRISVTERPVAKHLVGSILSVSTDGVKGGSAAAIREVRGQCNDGLSGCVVGLVLPVHYSGLVRVTVGVAATPSSVRHNTEMRSAR